MIISEIRFKPDSETDWSSSPPPVPVPVPRGELAVRGESVGG